LIVGINCENKARKEINEHDYKGNIKRQEIKADALF
jgi:hypothetical protein